MTSMTSIAPLTRTAIFRARDGQGEQLADRLLHAAALVAEAPGCELWLVHRDLQSPDTVRVCELWASLERCEASLELPGVRENAAEIMQLLGRAPEVVDGQPLVDEHTFELRALDAVRVAPASTREFEAGPEGVEVLAFGLHSPGDGEMVQSTT
jgi:quinol monooxygenase YgiN